MDNDLIPLQNNVIRHCKKKFIDEHGVVTSAAFKLRPEMNEEYLSISWLEFFRGTLQTQLDKARNGLSMRGLRIKDGDQLAMLNVEDTLETVRSKTEDHRILEFKHLPGTRFMEPKHDGNAHSGIFNIEPSGMEIAECLVESIYDTWPAKVDAEY